MVKEDHQDFTSFHKVETILHKVAITLLHHKVVTTLHLPKVDTTLMVDTTLLHRVVTILLVGKFLLHTFLLLIIKVDSIILFHKACIMAKADKIGSSILRQV